MNRLGVILFLFLVPLFHPNSAPVEAAWETLSGEAPIVIANGGTAGLFPDQTVLAYQDALNYSLPGVILSCDLQLVKNLAGAVQGICRTGLDLSESTTINILYPERNRTYTINGVNVTGWFTLDFNAEEILQNVTAKQSVLSRTSLFDDLQLAIFTPESVAATTPLWLNTESTSFFEEHGLNMTEYLISFLTQAPVPAPFFLSANEVTVLRNLRSAATTAETKLIFKFLDQDSVEPTTQKTYGALLANLSEIATFASGILVPKSYIWPEVDNQTRVEQPTSLVNDAHKANLEIYAYNFFNDEYPFPYNYSFDPVPEVLYFTEKFNFSVDGLFTDFPTTASEAIACYASNSLNASRTGGANQTIISHNGNSGDWPGCTLPAYTSAIEAGVDYIDCSVQITKDGVLICRESPDLVLSTNVASVPTLFETHYASYPGIGPNAGVFTFDLTWMEIESNLKSTIFSPSFSSQILRDDSNDGIYGILTLADFLSLAKNNSVGAFIDIQNAVYLRQKKNLAVVDAVVEALKVAGYTDPSEKVMLQSEDSSALARLRSLNVTYPLTYRIPYTTANPVSVTASDFVDIKEYATAVSIPRRLVLSLDSSTEFLLGPTQVVQWAQAQNLTVYFSFLRNEPTILAFDHRVDITMEMYTLTERYNIDGFITDFPVTTINYFENHCRTNGRGSSNINFTIPDIVPGDLNNLVTNGAPSPSAAPDLVVPEPPLAAAIPSSPSPSPVPAAASHLSTCILLSAAFSVLLHFLTVL